MLFGYDITWKQIIGYIVLAYIALDTAMFLLNGIKNTDPGRGCAKEDWIGGPFLINNWKKPASCPADETSTGLNTLGKWQEYALKNENGERLPYLYEAQVDKIVTDIKNNYVIEGYTPMELLAYIIIPVVTIESVGIWLLSTRANKAEWTFWILLLTLIFTGFSSLLKETANIEIGLPSETSCLNYLATGLGFTTGDELQYTFMARKQDGTNCMIEGTYLDTPDGGVEPETIPTIYRGDNIRCSSSNLQLY
jgi:hypothetical protein